MPAPVGRQRVDPEPQRDADWLQAGLDRLQQRDRAVDASRHRDRDATLRDGQRSRSQRPRERRVQRIGRQRDAFAIVLGRTQLRFQRGRPDARSIEQVESLDQPAGQRCRGRRVRTGEERWRAAATTPCVRDQLDPQRVAAAGVAGLAVHGAVPGRSGVREVERVTRSPHRCTYAQGSGS